jgi:type IV secretory pathway VirB4 component
MNPFVLESFVLLTSVIALSAVGVAMIPRLPFSLKAARQQAAEGFDGLLVTEYLIAPGISFNEDGAFTTGWILRGPDATTKTEGALSRMMDDFNAALSCTEQGWMYEFQRVRLPDYLSHVVESETFLSSPTHEVLAANRNAQICVDEVRLLVTYLPPDDATRTLASMLMNDTRTTRERNTLSDSLHALEEGCRMIEVMLQTCMLDVHRLSGSGNRDELVNTLYRNINGWTLPGVVLPTLVVDAEGMLVEPIPLREILAVQDFTGGMDLAYGQEYLRCISIVKYPHERWPRILAELAALNIPMRDHSRFIIGHFDEMTLELKQRFNDARDDASPVRVMAGDKSHIADREIAKRSLDKDALTRLKELQKVAEKHQNGTRKHAWYSRIIELRSEDLDELDRWTRALCETLRVAGFGVRVEEMHSVDAWLSTLGGNGYNFVRRTAAHGVMVADLANLTDAWCGRQEITCDKCALGTKPMLWARRADTLAPFALDLHAGDVMSAVVIGPIGYGKTTLVNTILGHSRKAERDRVIGIDYYRSEERTAVMLDGAYGYPGEENSPARLCPFTDLGTVAGQARAVEWCEFVLERDTSATVSGDVKKKIVEAVDFLASDQNWAEHACVTLFCQKLSAAPSIKDAFSAYASGGIYGHIFDATPNEMRAWQRPIRIYDTTALYSLSEAAALPALMIICSDTEREMDGRRMLLVIEEAHIPLKHKLLKPWLITLLRTTRKKHLGIVFVLTDVEGIDEATLRTLKSLCGTIYATENPNANATRDAYKFLGFSDAQIDALIPSRNRSMRRDGLAPLRYTYWQLGADGIAPFVLDLSSVELEVFAKGSDDDKKITTDALRDHPHEVPAAIFEAVGEEDAAADWRTINHARSKQKSSNRARSKRKSSSESGNSIDTRLREVLSGVL